jgi:hypothetical protein
MKSIRLSKHAQGYSSRRGFTLDEVINAIRNSTWKPVKLGVNCFECSAEYPFNGDWNGKYYKTKRVCPIFEERDLEIIVITVYTYYY